MKVYIYNNDFSNQSIRQMQTILDFTEAEEFYLGEKWQAYFDDKKYVYTNFKKFQSLKGKKGILFFSVLDGLKLIRFNDDKIKLFFRPRGLAPEESYFRNKKKFNKKLLDILEYNVLKKVDSFYFLNNNQMKHYISKYHRIDFGNKNMHLLPNVIRLDDGLVLNKRMSRNQNIKIVYSGGFSKWQNVELIYAIVRKIVEVSKIPITFTVLTFEDNFEQAKYYAEKYSLVNNISISYVEQNKLNIELQNYDLGIIIRDNSIVNRTASPFKLIDYISNGVGLITSSNFYEELGKIIKYENVFKVEFKNNEINIDNYELELFLQQFNNRDTHTEILELYNEYINNIPISELK